jgi:hypothetical protein
MKYVHARNVQKNTIRCEQVQIHEEMNEFWGVFFVDVNNSGESRTFRLWSIASVSHRLRQHEVVLPPFESCSSESDRFPSRTGERRRALVSYPPRKERSRVEIAGAFIEVAKMDDLSIYLKMCDKILALV